VAEAPGTVLKAALRPAQAALTAVELADAAIEVRNGNGTKNLAHQTRSLLHQEGFTVANIGDHVHFGAAKTIVYYRPGMERIARAVGHTVFPEAELAPSLKLNKGTDIKVLLGHDLLENPQFMARLNDGAPPAARFPEKSPATDKLLAAKTEAKRVAAGHQEPLGENQPKAGPGQQPLPPKSKEVMAQPLTSPGTPSLTAVELADAAIEVRNGNGTKNLAHQTRSLLHQEGFTVANIGDHVHFGAAKTIVYYRPGMERIARAVGHTVFPEAELAPSLKLNKGTDIKVLLGADLLERPELTARLVAENK
jgi:hypothetical protein